MSNPKASPVEIDTKLAGLYEQLATLDRKTRSVMDSLCRMAGARRRPLGTRMAWVRNGEELSDAEALQIAETCLDEHHLSEGMTRRQAIEKERACAEQRQTLYAKMRALEAVWHEDPWSRFFLVTSSTGHIHSNRRCSTCRPTTTFGWLPELSGKTEAEAVAQHGPALCSVCFPSAPVEWRQAKVKVADAVRAAA